MLSSEKVGRTADEREPGAEEDPLRRAGEDAQADD
jgi:hypothetical protein